MFTAKTIESMLAHGRARYAFIPQMAAILVLVGSAGKNFDISAVSVGSAGTVTANRCSFVALEFASVIGFAAIGATSITQLQLPNGSPSPRPGQAPGSL